MKFQSTKPISGWQLISAFPRWCKYSDSNTNTRSLSIIPSIPLCSAQSGTVSRTPGESDAVNVCTNRLLIEKLFMLSSGSIHIRGETGGAAPHHSGGASNTDAAVKVCLWLCLRGKGSFYLRTLVCGCLCCSSLPSLWVHQSRCVICHCTTYMPHAAVITGVWPNVHQRGGYFLSLSAPPHFWLLISPSRLSPAQLVLFKLWSRRLNVPEGL